MTVHRSARTHGPILPPEFLFSPVKGRSYVDNAAHHIGSRAFWQLDVADYFPSCSANNVARFFRRDLECLPDVTAILVKLVTLKESLPQGSPCSPILAYFSNQHMWIEIAEIVKLVGCKISIYADDITISGPIVRKAMIWRIKKLIHRHGLRLKPSKELSLIHASADITGAIVKSHGLHLPNRQREKIVSLKQLCRQTRDPKILRALERKIAGRAAQQYQVEGKVFYPIESEKSPNFQAK